MRRAYAQALLEKSVELEQLLAIVALDRPWLGAARPVREAPQSRDVTGS